MHRALAEPLQRGRRRAAPSSTQRATTAERSQDPLAVGLASLGRVVRFRFIAIDDHQEPLEILSPLVIRDALSEECVAPDAFGELLRELRFCSLEELGNVARHCLSRIAQVLICELDMNDNQMLKQYGPVVAIDSLRPVKDLDCSRGQLLTKFGAHLLACLAGERRAVGVAPSPSPRVGRRRRTGSVTDR